MSAIDELLERLRQTATGDTYADELPYALEIRGDPAAFGISGLNVFVFPLGPSEMSVERVFRASVEATLGGVVAEEQGIVWHQYRVSGNFGLEPKRGIDTTFSGKEGLYTGIKLSGPKWTNRMLRNIFDRYAALKADPSSGHGVQLVWYDFKQEEGWVIIPERVTLSRSTGTRGMYPFSLEFKAIAPEELITLPAQNLGLLAGFLAAINNVIDAIQTAVALGQAVFQEASEILGEIRYFAATIDSIIDGVGAIFSAAGDFADGLEATLSLGDMFVSSWAAALDEMLELLEPNDPSTGGSTTGDNNGELPDAVRQNFNIAADALDSIRSQFSASRENYASRAAEMGISGAGRAGVSDEELEAAENAGPPTSAADLANASVSSTDRGLIQSGGHTDERDFSAYRGFKTVSIARGDNLQSLAARYIGDQGKWYDIALLNNLSYPYISPAGGPGCLKPGDHIAIPTLSPIVTPRVASAGAGSTPKELYGVDMRLYETRGSRPSHPQVDLKIDPRTLRDVATIEGIPNLEQALQVRVWTQRGTYPMHLAYGMPQVVGARNTPENLTRVKLGLRGTVLRDSRIKSVRGMTAEVGDDTLDFDLQVVPVGATQETTIKTALV